jgi:hypothetical protein
MPRPNFWIKNNKKASIASFPHIAFSRKQRELLPARSSTLITTKKKTTERKQKNERRIIISSLKSCLPRE